MASPTFYIKQNDTSPKLEAFLQDDKGRPVNLTGSTVLFHMRLTSDLLAKVSSGSVTLEAATKGHVSYSWSSSDTDTAGIYQSEFQVSFVSGAVETFPNDDYIKIIVTDDVL